MEAFGPQTVIATFILKIFFLFISFSILLLKNTCPWVSHFLFLNLGFPAIGGDSLVLPAASHSSHILCLMQFIEISRKIKWKVELKFFSSSSSFWKVLLKLEVILWDYILPEREA